MEPFTIRLTRLRHQAGLTHDELAAATGLHRSHVYRLQHGQSRNPTVETLQKLAAALGVTVGELLVVPPSAGQARQRPTARRRASRRAAG